MLSSLQLLIVLSVFAKRGGYASVHEYELFEIKNPHATFTSCRQLHSLRTRSLLDCQLHWMRLKQLNAEPAFVHFDPSDDRLTAGGCEISAWCDQLLPNESESRIALLPVSVGQPRAVLFAVKSGSLVKVLDSFLNPVGCNGSLLVSPAVGPPPLDFWRSCWLDRLPDLMRLLAKKTLSVDIIKAGATALKISFDASFAGVNLRNWFSQDRLVSSEPDLSLASRSYNVFSAAGHSEVGRANRRFYVNTAFLYCTGDRGVLAVIEMVDVCAWGNAGNSSNALPRILFNPIVGVWEGNSILADYMLVTVG